MKRIVVVCLLLIASSARAFAPTGSLSRLQHFPHLASTVTTAPPSEAVTNSDLDESENSPLGNVAVAFSHIHLYVDHVEGVDIYKQLETKLNKLSSQCSDPSDVATCRDVWNSMNRIGSGSVVSNDDTEFVPQNRDVVKQLIAGLGYRVTGCRIPNGKDPIAAADSSTSTRSVLVTSSDPRGVQIVVSALDDDVVDVKEDEFCHFVGNNLKKFYGVHADRAGIAVLGFEVTEGSIEIIHDRYGQLHPKLLTESGLKTYADGTKILECYAYYQGECRNSEADVGTILRFVQRGSENSYACALPGLDPVLAIFDPTAQAAYCDHWVSNVNSRTGFLDTLEDVLGFTPKVDFNAGVVAAGEAQIESTVTGNDSKLSTHDLEVALRDQSQVYLPINNALSSVGHVHGFLQEIGQGIQHVASRVKDLPSFVQRANDNRKITGEGFTFLNIPRSYYGILTAKCFDSSTSVECARAILGVCEAHGVISPDGAVDLEITKEKLVNILDTHLPVKFEEEYVADQDKIVDTILHSRYANLYNLLGQQISEETYLKVVRNKILVDVQGEDLLLQIFTSNVLQRSPSDEAPFFEFIQRVCSECEAPDGCSAIVKAGCGGFGIRNFLTLFLSIEVSKAMLEASQAKAAGDVARQEFAQSMVDTFTDQLNEANPILTEISDAMTLEGSLRSQLDLALATNDLDVIENLRGKLEEAGEAKLLGNTKLMECSTKYMEKMKALRIQGQKSQD